MICPACERPLAVRIEWVGRDVKCPHCEQQARVPDAPADGQPIRGWRAADVGATAFTFACPRCKSLLESHSGIGGQTGRCPTCNAQFLVPHYDPRRGTAGTAHLLDTEQQDPTPMHAYAASGHQAPQLCRRADGTLQIECPRCGATSDVAANNCTGCGLPFSVEGVAMAVQTPGRGLAITSLVLGIVALPCSVAGVVGMVVGPAAIAFGLAGWLRRGSAWPPGIALAGMILGIATTLVWVAQTVL